MDVTQVLLIAVVTVLTILLAVIGVQVIFILGEIRTSLQKMNAMLSDAGTITHGISKSVHNMGGMLDGLKAGLQVVNFFGKKKDTTAK